MKKFFFSILGQDLLLDQYNIASHAYSMRKLKNNYTGFCVRVRRNVASLPPNPSIDEMDIGFDNQGFFDSATFNTFLNGSSPASTIGYVKVWYDQIGGQNMIQSNESLQPKINGTISQINSHVIDFINNKFFEPVLTSNLFYGLFITDAGFINLSTRTPLGIITGIGSSTSGIVYGNSTTNLSNQYITMSQNNNNTYASWRVTFDTLNQRYNFNVWSVDKANYFVLNKVQSTNTRNSFDYSQTLDFQIGVRGTYYYNSPIAELIFINSTILSLEDVENIQQNMKDAFNV